MPILFAVTAPVVTTGITFSEIATALMGIGTVCCAADRIIKAVSKFAEEHG